MTRAQFSKHGDIAGAAVSETMVVSDDQLTNAAPLEQHSADELGGVERGQSWREWEDDRVVQTAFRHGLKLFLRGAEKRRSCSRFDHLERMRMEGDEKARELQVRGAVPHTTQEIAVPQVNTVERTHSDHRT